MVGRNLKYILKEIEHRPSRHSVLGSRVGYVWRIGDVFKVDDLEYEFLLI